LLKVLTFVSDRQLKTRSIKAAPLDAEARLVSTVV